MTTTTKFTTTQTDRTILVCSCEQSMPLNLELLKKAAKGARVVAAQHLCGPELELFRKAAAGGRVTVACTAQRALFQEIAEDDQLAAAPSAKADMLSLTISAPGSMLTDFTSPVLALPGGVVW